MDDIYRTDRSLPPDYPQLQKTKMTIERWLHQSQALGRGEKRMITTPINKPDKQMKQRIKIKEQ